MKVDKPWGSYEILSESPEFKIKKIVVMLVIAGLILNKKNFFREFKAPKLKPMKPAKGIQGVSIFNW